jgi:hypothetical protein
MDAKYQTTYRDKLGQEQTVIENNGKKLSIMLRGITFTGNDFDAFSPSRTADPSSLSLFKLQSNDLCSCVIEFEMAVPLVQDDHTVPGRLSVTLELGDPKPNGGLDRERLVLALQFDQNLIQSSGNSGWFEGELLELQRHLPTGIYMKACINCLLSDYSPCGHGIFGNLACFRDHRDEYLSVKNKADIFRIWANATEFVQETYLCSKFERRVPGTGYRG